MKVKKDDMVFYEWFAIGVIVSLLIICSDAVWDQAEILKNIKVLMGVDILFGCWIMGIGFSSNIRKDQREKEGLRRTWLNKDFDELERRIEKLEEEK